MLKKEHRLSRESIQKHLQSGVYKLYTPSFSVIYKESDITQIGVSVSKKTLPTAVERNTLRRRVYGFFSDILPSLKKDIQILFIYKKKGDVLTQKEIEKEITTILRKESII